jgi:hypothetical protein
VSCLPIRQRMGQQCPVLMGRGRFRASACGHAPEPVQEIRGPAHAPASDRGPGRGGGCLLDSRTHYPTTSITALQKAAVTSHCARDFKDSALSERENEGVRLFRMITAQDKALLPHKAGAMAHYSARLTRSTRLVPRSWVPALFCWSGMTCRASTNYIPRLFDQYRRSKKYHRSR